MCSFKLLAAVLLVGPTAFASSGRATATANSACASVSMLAASTPTVPAQLAYECINSVPFNRSAAVALLDSIRPYLEWQTTFEYIEDPPKEYAEKVQPAFAFWDQWCTINRNAEAGNYSSEYQFGFQLYQLFQKCHDGHLVFVPDSVGKIFSFGRTTPLVSVSVDGRNKPMIFAYRDILREQQHQSHSNYQASQVMKINGQDAITFLKNWSESGRLQDRDALWNSLFYVPSQVLLGPLGSGTGTFSGGGSGGLVYPGPATSLTFANGSNLTTENYAKVLVSFDDIHTGEDLYRRFFIPQLGQVRKAKDVPINDEDVLAFTSDSATPPLTTDSALGYPFPVTSSPCTFNAGYYLEGEEYADVAVLSLPSFCASNETIFQEVNAEFLKAAKAAGKQKLIVDVSGNHGGDLFQAYDVFMQLFPQILPYGATRFRAHEAFNLIGKEASHYSGLVPRSLKNNQSVQDIIARPWNYRSDSNIDNEPFSSWLDKYGPHYWGPQNDTFTSIVRWNLSDVLITHESGGIYVSGYSNYTNNTQQPFAPEDIVIVYDGFCASTCAIFSELMTAQGGVRTIALGGRPDYNIIQAVGGVKGTNVYKYDLIFSTVTIPFKHKHYRSPQFYDENTILGEF